MSNYYTYPSKLLNVERGGFERVRTIEQAVCSHYKIPVYNLYQKRRNRDEFSEPFHVCFTMILEFTYIRKECIIEKYKRDRCTAYYAPKAVRNLEFSDVKFREFMINLRAFLNSEFTKTLKRQPEYVQ